MKKITSIAGAATGLLSVIFSFYILSMDAGSTENSFSYGGDAYTGIQNAAAQTANNVHYLNDILQFGFFAVLFVAGLALLCHYVPVLLEEASPETLAKINKKTSEKNTPADADAASEELKEYKNLPGNGVINEEETSAKTSEIIDYPIDTEPTVFK